MQEYAFILNVLAEYRKKLCLEALKIIMKKTYYDVCKTRIEIHWREKNRGIMPEEHYFADTNQDTDLDARFETYEEAEAYFNECGYNVPDVR